MARTKAPPVIPVLTVEQWPVDKPVPYAANPRKNAGAVAKVVASLREYGFRQPIVVDEAGVVIVGHTRLLAAKSLGLAEVPVHVATGLTPEQVRAYRIADNRTAEEAEWDDALLTEELLALQEVDFDLALTGFNQDELLRITGAPDDAAGFPALPDGEKGDFEQVTFTLHRDQADLLREALVAAKAAGPFVDQANENSNGNALARLAEMALGVLR